MTKRVHILGGSGSGTTTLGAHLALAIDGTHVDSDTFFWRPTDPPYAHKRTPEDRFALMEAMFLGRDKWVLSGAVMGWDARLPPLFDLVVRLDLPADIRMQRLREREAAAYGDRIQRGGDMHTISTDFMQWASGYDDPDFAQRSRSKHIAWCANMPCPILELDSTRPIADLVTDCLNALKEIQT